MKRTPVALGMRAMSDIISGNSWIDVDEIHSDEALLGVRYDVIVFYKNHPKLQSADAQHWVADSLRCRLEPHGEWIEVDW